MGFRQSLCKWFCIVSVVWGITACAPVAAPTPLPPPPTTAPTPLPPPSPSPTAALPGTEGAAFVRTGSLPEGVEIKAAFMTLLHPFEVEPDKQTAAPPRFPSGSSKLYLIVIFCPTPPSKTTLALTVTGKNGKVALAEIVTSNTIARPEGCMTYGRSIEPENGAFPDGPYQTQFSINSTPVAELNWAVEGN